MDMGKLTIVLSDAMETRLRALTLKKGDLSRIVEKALKFWIEKGGEAEDR